MRGDDRKESSLEGRAEPPPVPRRRATGERQETWLPKRQDHASWPIIQHVII
jgi:hypothetical protein